MRRIVHLSDIHFGKTDCAVVDRLAETVVQLEPHLMVVSGDLTQRARRKQFAEARDFLANFSVPKIVVPGNHDVPLYNVYKRFLRPLDNYKEFISDDLCPFFADDEIAVIGINTSRSLTFKGGRVNEKQVDNIRKRLDPLDENLVKIVVTHHPFDLPGGFDENHIVGRANKMMPKIAACGADIFLSGHLHISSITNSAHRYRLENGRAALIIQAGTAASTRGRGEANSFNLIETERPFITVKRYECSIPTDGFFLSTTERFAQTDAGWLRM